MVVACVKRIGPVSISPSIRAPRRLPAMETLPQEIQQRMKAESASRELETARQAHEQEIASLRAELEKARTEARDNAVAAAQARRRTKHAMHQFRKMQDEVCGLWLVAVAVRGELPPANACSHCCIVASQLVGLADDEQSDEEWRYALATP